MKVACALLLGVLVLRDPGRRRGFRVPLRPVIPILSELSALCRCPARLLVVASLLRLARHWSCCLLHLQPQTQ